MKKLVSVSLAAAMVASMTACGSNNTAETTAAAAAAETTAAAGETSAAAESQTAADGASFKIGVTGPLTGAAAAYGNAVVNGAKLAADEINAAGGVNGYTFEVNGQDGVIWNILSFAVSAATAIHGLEVVVPTRICIPQSFYVLYALIAFSVSFSSS